MKFIPPLTSYSVAGQRWALSFSGEYRRLYSDGVAMRIEVGLKARRRWGQPDLLSVVTGAALIDVQVPGPKTAALIRAGRPLSELLLRRTSQHDAPTQNWFVAPGEPLVIVEASRWSDRLSIPANTTEVKEKDVGIKGVRLLHVRVAALNGIPVSVWCLDVNPPLWRTAETWKQIRELRVHLMRLHSAREATKACLRAIGEGHLAVADRTQAADELQVFLHDQVALLQRDRSHGFDQAPLLEAAYASDALVNVDQVDTILREVSRARRQYARAITAAIQAGQGESERGDGSYVVRDTIHADTVIVKQTGVQFMSIDSSKNVNVGNVGDNFSGVIGFDNVISDSFKRIDSSDKPDELKAQLKALGEAVAALQKQVPDPDAEAAARDYEAFVHEATADKPRKNIIGALANGLLDTAKKAAEAGIPIVSLINAILLIV